MVLRLGPGGATNRGMTLVPARARALGLACGRLVPGRLTRSSDVPGVTVGHTTLVNGDIRTGVTAIRPHGGDVFRDRPLAASHVLNGFGKSVGRRVVLTGGASQLEGVRDLAELVLDKRVRLGRPKLIRGLPESLSGPAFATAAGLLRYGLREQVAKPDHAAMAASNNKRNFGRVGAWLRENF